MKIKSIIIACSMPISLLAQHNFFVSPIISYANTMVYNAEDTKNATRPFFGTNPLPMQTNFGGNIGLQFGYQLKQSKGLQAIKIGVQTGNYLQNYKGYLQLDTFATAPKFNDAVASVKLNYINIPLTFQFGLQPIGRFTPIANIGLIAGVLNNYAINFTSSSINDWQINYKIENLNYSRLLNDYEWDTYTATISKSIYNKVVLSSLLEIGTTFAINNKMDITGTLFNNYSFGDIENKEKVTYTYTDSYHKGQTRITNPHADNISIAYFRNYSPGNKVRGETHVIQTGLQLGFAYHF